MISIISTSRALAQLASDIPVAFIDTRPRQDYVRSHAVFSVNAPLDSLESQILQLFGTEAAIAIIIGQTDQEAIWAGRKILALTHLNPQVIEGGFSSWLNQNLPIWGGEYTPSKAFGEWVDQTGMVNGIEPKTAMQTVPDYQYDVRPALEFQKFSLSESQHCPTGRLGTLTMRSGSIYVHCAGRTRGIIAAQTLYDLNYPGTVRFINGGTQGWELQGGTRTLGNRVSQSERISNDQELERAERLAVNFAIPVLSITALNEWKQKHHNHRTLSVSEDGLSPSDISPTTLIQSTDQYLGTHHIPILITGTASLDVAVTALWLRRMGWDAYALFEAICQEKQINDHPVITANKWPGELRHHQILDTRPSEAFEKARVIGSAWCPRTQLTLHETNKPTLLIGDNAVTLNATARYAKILGFRLVQMRLWNEAPDYVVDRDPFQFGDMPSDRALFFPKRHDGDMNDSANYLTWEHSLLKTLETYGHIPWATVNDQRIHPKSHLSKFYQGITKS